MAEQAAWVINCQVHDIPILVSAKLLKPLGNPMPNSVKFFATDELLEHIKDPAWLNRVTKTIGGYWQGKNLARNRQNEAPMEPKPPAQ